jgi:hypothetical protein
MQFLYETPSYLKSPFCKNSKNKNRWYIRDIWTTFVVLQIVKIMCIGKDIRAFAKLINFTPNYIKKWKYCPIGGSPVDF